MGRMDLACRTDRKDLAYQRDPARLEGPESPRDPVALPDRESLLVASPRVASAEPVLTVLV